MSAALTGGRVEILKGFNHETGRRDICDEIAHCCGTVVECSGNDVLVDVPAMGSIWVNVRRLRTA